MDNIDLILEKVKKVWKANPELRLGQLFCQVANYGALYYSTNDDIIKLLEQRYNIDLSTVEIPTVETKKTYSVKLSIEDKDFSKVKENQSVEIVVKKEEKNLNYIGIVKKINKDPLAKSTIDIEITNSDENLQANLQAICTIIVEKAENVVALPIEAIQKDEEQKTYVDLVVEDGETTKAYVKTGISDDYYVEIKEGLNVGDRVQIVKSSTTVVNKGENRASENSLR